MALRCALYAFNNKVGWTVVTDRNCRAAFGEKLFVTAGNGHPTAIQRTAFRVFVTVVAALFQEPGVYCHAIIAMRCISSVCDCYSRNMDIDLLPLPHAGTECQRL